eukprot:Sspe_Gene.120070::Locus_117749_Transcript_1_2_Confidence_0.333_Length_751::g.120070::m.120070
MLLEKKSDKLRRRLRNKDLSCWQRFREYWESKGDPFEGIDRIPHFNRYLHCLRPWDSKPSDHYKKVLEKKYWWYNNPPSFLHMLSVLGAFAIANLVVALLPPFFYTNYNRMYELYRDLKRPAYVYENAGTVLFVWVSAHILSSLAPWFVYLTGGMHPHRYRMVPYGLMLVLEALLPDIFFGGRRIDLTLFALLGCIFCNLVTMYAFHFVTYLSVACLVPILGVFTYMTVLAG